MVTLEQTLNKTKGIGPGFDFLRIGLAISIVLTHAALQTGRNGYRDTPFWFIEFGLVPMFFALSGFLVAGSAQRLSLSNFLINRGLRILPALAVDIVFCALIVGPLMTTVDWASYFTNKDFFKYFLNITGWIHYSLPGVFKDHFNTRVNGALWTVPYEMFCYIIMSGLIITKWVKNWLMVAVITLGILFAGLVTTHFLQHTGFFGHAMNFVFVSRGGQLLVTFLLGILYYQLKHVIPYSWALFWACVAICIGGALILDKQAIDSVPNRFVLLPALVYITVFLGLTKIPVPKIVHTGDYSYGIYLYHDPLLQIWISLLPAGIIAGGLGYPVLAIFGIAAVALFAAFSWHVIEKPILSLRKKFSFVARVRGVAGANDVSVAPKLPDDPGTAEAAAPASASAVVDSIKA
jgi:peptidoglycan/LPS O-acetylase OafA/YrhL